MVEDEDEGFALGRPSTLAEGEGLYLTSDELRILIAFLANKADDIDARDIDKVSAKIVEYIDSELTHI